MPNELIKELSTFVKGEATNYPPPLLATINKVSSNGKHIDCLLSDDKILKYVRCIGNPVLNEDVLIFFVEGDINSPVAIAK